MGVKVADFAKKVPVIDKEKIEKIKKAVSGWSMDTPSRDDWTKEPSKEKSKDEASDKDASKDAPKDAPETDDIEEIHEIEDESSMDVPAHASSANDSVDATSADVSEDASRDAEDATENATED